MVAALEEAIAKRNEPDAPKELKAIPLKVLESFRLAKYELELLDEIYGRLQINEFGRGVIKHQASGVYVNFDDKGKIGSAFQEAIITGNEKEVEKVYRGITLCLVNYATMENILSSKTELERFGERNKYFVEKKIK